MPTKKKKVGDRLCQTARDERRCGFTFTELVVVIVIVSMFVLLAVPNIYGILGRNSFETQARELAYALQMAARAACESDDRYEVIIDLTEQEYIVRKITTSNLAVVLDEEIIIRRDFGSKCEAAYVEFDDMEWTNEGRAKFRAGHAGWQYGGKIVLLDSEQQPYSVIINRMDTKVKLKEGEVNLLLPRRADEMRF